MTTKFNEEEYEILTEKGFKSFKAVQKLLPKKILKISTNSYSIRCSEKQRIFINPLESIIAKELRVNDVLYTSTGYEEITSIEKESSEEVFDILDVADKNSFYCNEVLVHNCEFVGQISGFLSSTILRELITRTNNTQVAYTIDNDVRFYKEVDSSQKYLISLDPSMGVEGDFSAIQVIEYPSMIQIAEWLSDKTNQNNQVEKIKVIADWIYAEIKRKGNNNPSIYWSFENNTAGEGISCVIREKEKGLSYIKTATMMKETNNKRWGFTTTARTKALACAKLKELVESRTLKINSQMFVRQIGDFTRDSVNYSAKNNNHDDLVSALLINILMYLQGKNDFAFDMDEYKIQDGKKRFIDKYCPIMIG